MTGSGSQSQVRPLESFKHCRFGLLAIASFISFTTSWQCSERLLARSVHSFLDGKGESAYSPFPDRRECLTKPVELPQGTLEMLILKAVSLGPLHGYGILLRIQQISGERLEILQGSFYTAIYRLERRGWIRGEWGASENNRRARFYSLTVAGTRQLKAETARWIDMTAVVAGILDKKAGEI